MSEELDNRIKVVSEKYRDLKKCESTTKKNVLVSEIKTLC